MVLVGVIKDKANYSREDLIKRVMSDQMFQFISFDQDDMTEKEKYKSVLRKSKEIDINACCIVIHDTSITTLSSESMTKIISEIIEEKFDLAYICKWDDYCQLHVKINKKDANREFEIVKTQHPSGVQAIIFSPSGRDIILGEKPMLNGKIISLPDEISNKLTDEVYNGNIKAITTLPNVFDYDIALNAMKNDDYLKVNMCSVIKLIDNVRSSGSKNVLWFLIVVSIVLIVAWAIIKIGPKISNRK